MNKRPNKGKCFKPPEWAYDPHIVYIKYRQKDYSPAGAAFCRGRDKLSGGGNVLAAAKRDMLLLNVYLFIP